MEGDAVFEREGLDLGEDLVVGRLMSILEQEVEVGLGGGEEEMEVGVLLLGEEVFEQLVLLIPTGVLQVDLVVHGLQSVVYDAQLLYHPDLLEHTLIQLSVLLGRLLQVT